MKHKFNIGDTVVVINGRYAGTEGVVREYHHSTIGKRKGITYLVKHNDNTIPEGLYWVNELKFNFFKKKQ